MLLAHGTGRPVSTITQESVNAVTTVGQRNATGLTVRHARDALLLVRRKTTVLVSRCAVIAGHLVTTAMGFLNGRPLHVAGKVNEVVCGGIVFARPATGGAWTILVMSLRTLVLGTLGNVKGVLLTGLGGTLVELGSVGALGLQVNGGLAYGATIAAASGRSVFGVKVRHRQGVNRRLVMCGLVNLKRGGVAVRNGGSTRNEEIGGVCSLVVALFTMGLAVRTGLSLSVHHLVVKMPWVEVVVRRFAPFGAVELLAYKSTTPYGLRPFSLTWGVQSVVSRMALSPNTDVKVPKK